MVAYIISQLYLTEKGAPFYSFYRPSVVSLSSSLKKTVPSVFLRVFLPAFSPPSFTTRKKLNSNAFHEMSLIFPKTQRKNLIKKKKTVVDFTDVRYIRVGYVNVMMPYSTCLTIY